MLIDVNRFLLDVYIVIPKIKYSDFSRETFFQNFVISYLISSNVLKCVTVYRFCATQLCVSMVNRGT